MPQIIIFLSRNGSKFYLCSLGCLGYLSLISLLSGSLRPRWSAIAPSQSVIDSAILPRCRGISWPLSSLCSKSISRSNFHRLASGTEDKTASKLRDITQGIKQNSDHRWRSDLEIETSLIVNVMRKCLYPAPPTHPNPGLNRAIILCAHAIYFGYLKKLALVHITSCNMYNYTHL